jgi:hypothetical protein
MSFVLLERKINEERGKLLAAKKLITEGSL